MANDTFFRATDVLGGGFDLIKSTIYPKTTTSFFTPYQGAEDVAKTLVSPIGAPLIWSSLGVASALISAASAVASLGLLVAAAGAAVARKENASNYLQLAGQAAILSCATLIAAPALVIWAALSSVINLTQIFTRTGATIKDTYEAHQENKAFVF